MIPAFGRIVLLFSGLGLILIAGCDRRLIQALTHQPSTVASSPAVEAQTPVQFQTQPKKSAAQQPSASYQQALDRAKSAAVIAQSAQSKDDWQLVVNRWRQAIDLLKTVPQSSRDYSQAQGKLQEYRRALAQAQQRLSRTKLPEDSDAVIVLAPSPVAPPAAIPRPTVTHRAAASPVPAPTVSEANPRAFSAPIIRRAGNTPVIRVLFNGNQPFDMILDTGASGTVITSQMAAALGVVPVSEARVSTASERDVTFPLGYVQSIEVGGAVAQNVMVAIAGPNLDLGLLGHDFFGDYDLVIRADRVEFRERG